MAKSENQKLKLLYLLKIFSEETDEDHMLTMPQIIDRLEDYGIHADRKTLYLDFAELNKMDGLEIVTVKEGRNTYYHMGQRLFELPELKLLVDSVQAAKFITDRKSDMLIHKLEHLVSRHEATQLQRQVIIAGRVKTPNKSIYYNVDEIYSAIGSNRQITFHYFQWNVKKEQVLRRGGALYHVSPWCLVWDDEYYYLVGYESAAGAGAGGAVPGSAAGGATTAGAQRIASSAAASSASQCGAAGGSTPAGAIKHFRVDKMKDLQIVAKPRDGLDKFKDFDTAKYTKSLVGMYGGDKTTVTVEASNDMAGVFIDRFGQDIWIMPVDDDHFIAHLDVVPSRQFLGWIFALGSKVRITGPAAVVADMRQAVAEIAVEYGGTE